MNQIVTALIVVVLTCGVASAEEEAVTGFEHLKCYGPFLGHWRYEGPLLEDIPDFADKGSNLVAQLSWKRILNKNSVEHSWSVEFVKGPAVSGKALIGWNADDEEIVTGGMDSIGGLRVGNVTPQAKTLTVDLKGVNGNGEQTSSVIVLTKKGADTLTWQASDRGEGNLVEGSSPVYTFQRVKRPQRNAE